LHGNVGGLQSKDTDIVELTKHKLYNTNGICVIGKPCYTRLSLKEVALFGQPRFLLPNFILPSPFTKRSTLRVWGVKHELQQLVQTPYTLRVVCGYFAVFSLGVFVGKILFGQPQKKAPLQNGEGLG
jgi:hypothetical protein